MARQKVYAVEVTYQFTGRPLFPKDHEIRRLAGRDEEDAGTMLGPVCERDLCFEYSNREEAKAAVARISKLDGVKARLILPKSASEQQQWDDGFQAGFDFGWDEGFQAGFDAVIRELSSAAPETPKRRAGRPRKAAVEVPR